MLTLILEIKGLGLFQGLNPNINVTGHAMFSQRKEIATLSITYDEDDASESVKVRQFTLQKKIITFAKELKGDPSHSQVSNNDTICDRMQSLLHLDRNTPFLSCY